MFTSDKEWELAIQQLPPRNNRIKRLAAFLEKVRSADVDQRSSMEFHDCIWNSEVVSKTGRGHVDVSRALADANFRSWIARESLKPVPEIRAEAKAHLRRFHDGILEKLAIHTDRTPRLKVRRVAAAFYPGHITALVSADRLRRFYAAFCGKVSGKKFVELQFDIVEKLDRILGRPNGDIKSIAERMTFPHRLWVEHLAQEPD